MLIHWATQSLAQLEDVYGPARARQLLDNTTTLTIWGGLKDQRTLEWVSVLGDHHDRLRYQQHSDGMLSPGRTCPAPCAASSAPTDPMRTQQGLIASGFGARAEPRH